MSPAPALILILLAFAAPAFAAPPHLAPKGSTRQLIVGDKPFLILGGELGNSTASDRMHLNTIVAPVSWELVEPTEGRVDWTSLDGLLADARAANKHLVLLWFGSWKNSMSSYVP